MCEVHPMLFGVSCHHTTNVIKVLYHCSVFKALLTLGTTIKLVCTRLIATFTILCSLFSLFILSACRGNKGEAVLRGKFDNLNQAEFFIYSTDNQRSAIDTIRVMSGRFEYTCQVHDDATLHLVYPHLAEQVIFVSSGDVIDIKGDANNLRDVEIKGNDDNKAYTKLRHTLNLATSDVERDSIIQRFIDDNPDNRVAYYMRSQLRLQQEERNIIRKEVALPYFQLIDREDMDTTVCEQKRGGRTLFNADTLRWDDIKGHRTMVVFWCHWFTGDNRATRQVRESLRTDDSLRVVTISADMRYNDHFWDIRSDSCLNDKYNKRWYAYCDRRGPRSGLFVEWGIRDLPHFVYVDTAGVVKASTRDFENDIRPLLKKK